MRVCMFVLNNCRYDTRVLKEARTLTGAGHDVRIIATLDGDTEPYEEKDGFRIIRVARDPVDSRLFAAIAKAESFAAGLASSFLDLFRSTPHRTGVVSAPSAARSEHSSGPTPPGDVSTIWLVYRRVRRAVYWPLKTVRLVLRTPLSLLDYYLRSWRVAKLEPVDIYHCHDLTTLPAGYIAKRRMGGKLVYDSHELFTTLHYIRRWDRPMYRFLERHLIRRADAVITVNEFAAGWLSKRYRITPPVVVRNCPPLAAQGGQLCNASLRESLGLDDTVPVIVHVGKFASEKGSEKLVSAVPLIDRGVLVFLGWASPAEEIRLRELVRRMDLEDRVLFAPPVAPDHVVSHIGSAQVGVVPFLDFGLNHLYATPVKLWECIGAGLPVVSSNLPALKAIVEGCGLGCTCDAEYPEDIADAIDYVLSDKSRYEEMKRNALAAAKIFNWENESERLLEVYRRLACDSAA
jgi:glycosyltransferase involved in cell wall biosynthesis